MQTLFEPCCWQAGQDPQIAGTVRAHVQPCGWLLIPAKRHACFADNCKVGARVSTVNQKHAFCNTCENSLQDITDIQVCKDENGSQTTNVGCVKHFGLQNGQQAVKVQWLYSPGTEIPMQDFYGEKELFQKRSLFTTMKNPNITTMCWRSV